MPLLAAAGADAAAPNENPLDPAGALAVAEAAVPPSAGGTADAVDAAPAAVPVAAAGAGNESFGCGCTGATPMVTDPLCNVPVSATEGSLVAAAGAIEALAEDVGAGLTDVDAAPNLNPPSAGAARAALFLVTCGIAGAAVPPLSPLDGPSPAPLAASATLRGSLLPMPGPNSSSLSVGASSIAAIRSRFAASPRNTAPHFGNARSASDRLLPMGATPDEASALFFCAPPGASSARSRLRCRRL